MNKPTESISYQPRQVQLLQQLVRKGEGARLEFKRKASNPEKIAREMIAFANTDGGTLLVGIGDDGSIPGLKYPEDDAHVVNEILKRVRPALPLTETFIALGHNRTVIQYDIQKSEQKPHHFLNTNQVKESFVRVEDKSIKASREVREIIRRQQKQKDIQFRYGEHEQFLMKYLDEHKHITLKEFVSLTGMKRFYASKKLVLLVLADVLRVSPHEKGDVYSIAYRKVS
ncbi:AlbA family DNA-binding domain-containing protein [Chryseolinea lacunae]|uniref:ATP-binding protein n=1 Tax=Chryseolinea lacunae TaxID=2801331 RepID=A0ABS1KT15_9BACT|nr:ATP-binding protein [Chryseolinea lacunae]MBL0742463.1 ATP-binding protein [Chryseolinea lacunae]